MRFTSSRRWTVGAVALALGAAPLSAQVQSQREAESMAALSMENQVRVARLTNDIMQTRLEQQRLQRRLIDSERTQTTSEERQRLMAELSSKTRMLAMLEREARNLCPVRVQPMGYLGVTIANSRTVNLADTTVLGAAQSSRVVSVTPGSPADLAGIVPGDLMISVDGRDFRAESNQTYLQPGRRVSLVIDRDGVRRQLTATIAQRPVTFVNSCEILETTLNAPANAATLIRMTPSRQGGAPMARGQVQLSAGLPPLYLDRDLDLILGARVDELSGPDWQAIFGVTSGLLVLNVEPGSQFERAGLKAGDVIRRAGRTQTLLIGDLRRVISEAVRDRVVELEIVRQRSERKLTLRW
jgi:C-terminal processing protease CtpA/Prc